MRSRGPTVGGASVVAIFARPLPLSRGLPSGGRSCLRPRHHLHRSLWCRPLRRTSYLPGEAAPLRQRDQVILPSFLSDCLCDCRALCSCEDVWTCRMFWPLPRSGRDRDGAPQGQSKEDSDSRMRQLLNEVTERPTLDTVMVDGQQVHSALFANSQNDKIIFSTDSSIGLYSLSQKRVMYLKKLKQQQKTQQAALALAWSAPTRAVADRQRAAAAGGGGREARRAGGHSIVHCAFALAFSGRPDLVPLGAISIRAAGPPIRSPHCLCLRQPAGCQCTERQRCERKGANTSSALLLASSRRRHRARRQSRVGVRRAVGCSGLRLSGSGFGCGLSVGQRLMSACGTQPTSTMCGASRNDGRGKRWRRLLLSAAGGRVGASRAGSMALSGRGQGLSGNRAASDHTARDSRCGRQASAGRQCELQLEWCVGRGRQLAVLAVPC